LFIIEHDRVQFIKNKRPSKHCLKGLAEKEAGLLTATIRPCFHFYSLNMEVLFDVLGYYLAIEEVHNAVSIVGIVG
jgi:hypothetical protein